ncbi:hypothetical protein AB0J55_02050 [Amycolatopsis sp. NPDC049688]|uniref:hypothetical protein n=1 Tax=Amycolatopsis sp. NPDC049688 TaxID=3154733 RepID=UPI00341C1972
MTAQAPAGANTRQPAPPEADDTTRYLAAAAHLDRHYADEAVREFLTEPTRQVPPPMGLDTPAVLTEAVAARSRRKYRDGVLAVLGIVVLATGFTSMFLYSWLGWAALLSIRPIWRKTRWDRPGGLAVTCLRLAGLFLLYVVSSLAPLLIIVAAVLGGASSKPACTGYYCRQPVTSSDDVPVSVVGGTGGVIAVLCALVMLVIVVADRVVVWHTVVRHFGRWARHRTDVTPLTDDRLAIQAAPARFREELRRHRSPQPPRSSTGGFPLVVYRGRNPFVGAGTSVGAWSTAIPLEETAGARHIRPLTTDRLYRAAAAAVTTLGETGALSPDQRLKTLGTSGVVFASAEALLAHAGDPIRDEYLPAFDAPPVAFLSPAESNRVYATPREWARYYLHFQVETWNRELVFSAFLHAAVDDSTLYLEWTPCVLAPVRDEFRAPDRMTDSLLAPVRQGLLRWARLPVTLPGRLWHAVTLIRPRPHDRYTIDPDRYGNARTLRELGAAGSVRDYFQIVDVERYTKLLESRLVPAISEVLRDCGYSPASFEQRIAAVITNNTTITTTNTGTTINGGTVNGAVSGGTVTTNAREGS